MHISKHALKALPKIEDEMTSIYMDYAQDVLTMNKSKSELLKEHFPDMYEQAIERSNGNPRVVNANVTKAINSINRRKDVKAMFETANKHAWISFLGKKNKLYENLYGLALDEDVIPRDRINASKVMLEHMPTFQEDINVKVEVKQNKEDFVNQLKEMQRKLYVTAVSEDILDAEVDE